MITQMNPLGVLRSDLEELNRWYDIHRPFEVRRLPIYFGSENARARGHHFPFFSKMAVLYSRFHQNAVVYTRSFYIAYLSVRYKLPTIIETHVAREWDQFDYFQKMADNNFLRGVVISSPAFKTDFLAAGVAEEKIVVWPNAVDLTTYQVFDDQKNLRKRLGIAPDQFVVTYTGHLYSHKGIDTILKCAQLMPDILFLVIGGWDEDVNAFRANYHGLQNVNFLGFMKKSEILPYLTASDALLMPNTADTPLTYRTPLKMFEYMASKRPLIASDLPEFRKFLNDQNSILIKPEEPAMLKEAILKLKKDSSYGDRLTLQAYQTVKNFTWDRRAQEILEKFAPEQIKK
jgi:glycosyltransferase involved in cell wall biosynthesis